MWQRRKKITRTIANQTPFRRLECNPSTLTSTSYFTHMTQGDIIQFTIKLKEYVVHCVMPASLQTFLLFSSDADSSGAESLGRVELKGVYIEDLWKRAGVRELLPATWPIQTCP